MLSVWFDIGATRAKLNSFRANAFYAVGANEKFHLCPACQEINSFFHSPYSFLLLNSGCSLETEPKQTDFLSGCETCPGARPVDKIMCP
jgi:hypothetical protein